MQQQPVHAIFLQHGLWGQAVNMAYLEGLLKEAGAKKSGCKTVVVNSEVNERYNTYEGVDACGERFVDLIYKTCDGLAEENTPVTHITIIGYSMGGLMARYAVGKLYSDGFFAGSPQPDNSQAAAVSSAMQQHAATGMPDLGYVSKKRHANSTKERKKVVPVSFITVATPHLGTWMTTESWWNRTFNAMVPRVAARSGTHFMLLDTHALGRPLLINMADPDLPFMKGLACFQHLMVLANTLHDRTVPYCTASIRETNPYEKSDSVPIDPRYPSIVQPAPESTPADSQTCSPRPKALCSVSAENGQNLKAESIQTRQAERDDVDGASMVSEQAMQTQKSRARKGLAVRVVFLACFPITIPLACGLLTYMVAVGRKQWAAVGNRVFDHSWVERSKQQMSKKLQQPQQSNTKTPQQPPRSEDLNPPHKHGLITQLAGQAMSVPSRELHSLSVQPSGELPASVSASSQRNTPTSRPTRQGSTAVSENDVQVSIDGGAREFNVHSGLVETPGSEREAQLWMMKQLNALPWVKVDVDTRHYHAHAAIMLRNPERFKDNADCLQYLVDNMKLDVAS